MRTKKVYIAIMFGLVFLAIGFFVLRSDVPDEPIIMYKVTTPAERSETQTETTTDQSKIQTETAKSNTAEGGHSHADGTFQEETEQEKKARLMQRLAEVEAKTKVAEAKTKAYRAETKAYRDEIEAIKAKNAERTKYLSQITEKGKEIVAAFPDVLAITSEKYLAFSETEQEEFLFRSVEYDVVVDELKNIVASTPQWVLNELEERQPGAIDDFLNLPYLSDLLPELSDLHGRL